MNIEDIIFELNCLEDTEKIKKMECANICNEYVSFDWHEGAFNNLKLLNSLKHVIPSVKNLCAHEGGIFISLVDGRELEIFSGNSTADVVELLVLAKFQPEKLKKSDVDNTYTLY